jgi:hypothetical protein
LLADGVDVEATAVQGPAFWQSVEIERCDALIDASLFALTGPSANAIRRDPLPLLMRRMRPDRHPRATATRSDRRRRHSRWGTSISRRQPPAVCPAVQSACIGRRCVSPV